MRIPLHQWKLTMLALHIFCVILGAAQSPAACYYTVTCADSAHNAANSCDGTNTVSGCGTDEFITSQADCGKCSAHSDSFKHIWRFESLTHFGSPREPQF